jgi:YaiO family outer membrane protein
MYPALWARNYGYINIGYSDATIFPEWRGGAEFYQMLPAAFEASAGFRRLVFANSDVTLFTGSLSKYKGNYYTTLRSYASQHKGEGTSWSGALQVRRYFSTADEYITAVASYGESPEPDTIQEEINRLNSWGLRFNGQTMLGKSFILSGKAGYRDQQFASDVHRRSYFVGAGFGRKF